MPEGPEIWILSQAINQYYACHKTRCIGKHLIVDNKEDWTFGLKGKVVLTDKLSKTATGWVNGDSIEYTDELITHLGIDWMVASEEQLLIEINKWTKSKKKLAGLLIDQSKICGIGVAWGSEILYIANLNPDERACEQDLSSLVPALITVRNNVTEEYTNYLNHIQDVKEFINEWFNPLYDIRTMNVYKKGDKIEVLGRNWYK